SFQALSQVETGVESANVLTMNVPFMMSKFKQGAQASSYARRILTAVQSIPGVHDAAVTTSVPLTGGWFSAVEIVGKTVSAGPRGDSCYIKMISADYFRALGIRLKRGRALAVTDTEI